MEGKGMVCVTCGTGFVASWLIMRLLEQGYTVRTTVRSKPTEGKQGIGYLTDLPGARERLQIFHADLDRPDSFNEAIEGSISSLKGIKGFKIGSLSSKKLLECGFKFNYEEKGLVCVTGGTGFVASWLIMRLLEHGYTVRTTIRSSPGHKLPHKPTKSGEKLQVFNADLDDPDSFNEAIGGCMGVFHLAFPLDFAEREPEEVITKRAVDGTLGVLRACVNAKTVKRVVCASSQATVIYGGDGDEKVADESSWTSIDYYRSLNRFGTSYLVAKNKTERAALGFAEQYGLDLVFLIPPLIVGPFICPRIPESIRWALSLIFGEKRLYHLLVKLNVVHTDDVAMAYIFLLESPHAKGRYICSWEEISINEMSDFLSARYPEFQTPTKDSLKDIKGFKMRSLSPKKLLDCGFKFEHGLVDMLATTILFELILEREREMEGERGRVCVTGGTGYLASWLIMKLLEQGYLVNTTVRPHPGGSERLQIFYADLSDPSGFAAAIKGCIGVFHVATPLPLDFGKGEPEEVVIERAINGTLGILRACLNSKTVKRVVYTSSASAVVFNDSGEEMMDESYWSNVDYLKASNLSLRPYFISKTLTEKRALEFAEEHGLDLVTLIPTYILGPFICPNMPASVLASLAMVLGNREQYGSLIETSMVHIDDVARAHIFLLQNPEAKGRYICSSHMITIEEMSKFLSAKFPEYPIPTYLKDVKGSKSSDVSSKKLLDSGFKFRYGLDEMFDEPFNAARKRCLNPIQ
uniref:NAD-dependent epimerase/dehydratase domain-containing protein n=1 Tax=Salix viminalis TaxID=40686 RepID=A0A6N2L7F9_SALVM